MLTLRAMQQKFERLHMRLDNVGERLERVENKRNQHERKDRRQHIYHENNRDERRVDDDKEESSSSFELGKSEKKDFTMKRKN